MRYQTYYGEEYAFLSLMRQFSWHSNSEAYLLRTNEFVPAHFELISLNYAIQPHFSRGVYPPNPPPRPPTPPPRNIWNNNNNVEFGNTPPPPYSPHLPASLLRTESSASLSEDSSDLTYTPSNTSSVTRIFRRSV